MTEWSEAAIVQGRTAQPRPFFKSPPPDEYPTDADTAKDRVALRPFLPEPTPWLLEPKQVGLVPHARNRADVVFTWIKPTDPNEGKYGKLFRPSDTEYRCGSKTEAASTRRWSQGPPATGCGP